MIYIGDGRREYRSSQGRRYSPGGERVLENGGLAFG